MTIEATAQDLTSEQRKALYPVIHAITEAVRPTMKDSNKRKQYFGVLVNMTNSQGVSIKDALGEQEAIYVANVTLNNLFQQSHLVVDAF